MNRLVELRRDRSRREALPWTDARIAHLKVRWSQGVTAQRIARELGGGISRSAVLGKIHRLGFAELSPVRGCTARNSKEQVSAASPTSYGPRWAGPLRADNGRHRPG
jgi:GcrA cell cycle regulator